MPAVSPEQQRLFGQAYAIKTGKLKPSDLNPEYKEQIVKLADSMTAKKLKDFAETKHDEMEEEEESETKIYEMENIPTFEEFLNESSRRAVVNTLWSKYPNSKEGDLFISKRQGVFAVKHGDILRPIYMLPVSKDTFISGRGFETDKQFFPVELDAKKIADIYFRDLWDSRSDARESADFFGKTVVGLVKDLIDGKANIHPTR